MDEGSYWSRGRVGEDKEEDMFEGMIISEKSFFVLEGSEYPSCAKVGKVKGNAQVQAESL